MSIYVNNTYRIRRNAFQQAAMQKLVSAHIFDGYKDILMLSAVIGYTQGRYVPIEKAASDGVLMQFFTQRDYDIMDLIAYAHQKQQSIINSDEKYVIFASYANGGFPILLEKLGFSDDVPLSPDYTYKMLMRLYMLLLTDGFTTEELIDTDLFI